MIGALIIVFREVIEAGLIIGIVLAATRGVPGRGQWVGLGVVAGVLGASMIAAFAGVISESFQGMGQELLNAAVLCAAVAMLIWHNVWMARHGREMAQEMVKVGQAVSAGSRPLTALAVVVGLAVLREGAEVVLFLYGIVAGGTSGSELLLGGVLGLAAGAAFTGLTYLGLLSIPSRYIFKVTAVLIALLAAGMAAQAVQYFNAAGLVTAMGNTLWDTSEWLSQDSITGRIMHALMGYNERPSLLQVAVYVAVLVAMFLLMRMATPPQRAQTAPSTS
jgi:high-affinity iron transporter